MNRPRRLRSTRETHTRSCAHGSTGHRTAAAEPQPLPRVAAAAAALALSWGAFQVTHTLQASRHDSTPVSASSQAPPTALTVPGHEVTRALPPNWPSGTGSQSGQLRRNSVKTGSIVLTVNGGNGIPAMMR